MLKATRLLRHPLLVLVLVAGSLAGAFAARPAGAGEGGDTLRVMSFNVRLGVADDGENSWEQRKALLARTVQDFDPDLLGTQETWKFQAEYLLAQLPGREYVGWPRQPGNEKDGEECGILFRAARFEKLDAGQFWLSETPEVPASKSWDSSLPRVVTWVRLRDRQRPDTGLVFVNTHFDHRGAEARRESAKLLRERLPELSPSAGAWILTGDFNSGDDSPPYRVLTEEAGVTVIDSYRAVHPERRDDEGTFSGFRGRRSGPRIDWVLHGPSFETLSAAIDRTEEDGRNPSDHYPVTAVLRWARSVPANTSKSPTRPKGR